MRKRKILLQIIISFVLLSGCSNKPPTLAELTQLLENTAEEGEGISKKELEVSDDINKMGKDAIPHLISLLKHKNKKVQDLAAFTLGGIDGLKPSHLNALIDAAKQKDRLGWLPHAIAEIGTPEAINYLAEELVKDKQQYTQLTFAFEYLGEKGIPYLIQLYTKYEFDYELQSCINFILIRMKEKAVSAIDPLLEIAKNEKLNKNVRGNAIFAIAQIGPSAKRVLADLKELSANDPESFKGEVDEAIINMRLPEAVPILLNRLEKEQTFMLFRKIAALGENGKSAGPTLVRYLKHNNWGLRNLSAETVGYIGYTEAGPLLIDALKTDSDWGLVIAAIDALRRLKIHESIPELSHVRDTYWFPPVREAAAKAIKTISENNTRETKNHFKNEANEEDEFLNEYGDIFKKIDMKRYLIWETMDKWKAKTYYEPDDQLDKKSLEKLVYNVETLEHDREGEHVSIQKQVPDVGIKLSDGYLVGSDRGEWGGELSFIGFNGEYKKLLDENINGIFKMSSGIVTLGGLDHLGPGTGFIYKVLKDEKEGWRVEVWKKLPGVPHKSWLQKDGKLFVYCSYACLTIDPDGTFKIVE
jgi:HEAT repeat protein